MKMSKSRELRRARKQKAKKLSLKPKGKLKAIDLNNKEHANWMTRAYINNRFVVMINDNANTTKGKAIRVMVQSHDNIPIANHWSELQSIKNELFGEEAVAIEYYPKQSELIDDKNIYWLWVFEENLLPIPIN